MVWDKTFNNLLTIVFSGSKNFKSKIKYVEKLKQWHKCQLLLIIISFLSKYITDIWSHMLLERGTLQEENTIFEVIIKN